MSAGPADHHIGKDAPQIEPPHPARRHGCGKQTEKLADWIPGAGGNSVDRRMRSVATC